MVTGIEAAKGAAERVFGARLPVLMRTVLPGFLATAVLYPVVAWMVTRFPSDPEHVWERVVAYVALALLLGAVASAANNETYKLYEGRIPWPGLLARWALRLQKKRVKRLREEAKAAPTTERYDELWYQLRDYPIGDGGEPEPTHPSLMGNILAAYEQYPSTRYGMDSVFYWSRIWLQVEKDRKEEIDNQWCMADGLLALSAISYSGGFIWALQAVADLFGLGRPWLPFGSVGLTLAAVPVWIVTGYLFYRFSIPYHRANGELFKAIFDIYRDKVWNMTSLKPAEKESWPAAWAYLQYLAFKCPNCSEYTSILKDDCENCGFGMAELKRSLSVTGQFPK